MEKKELEVGRTSGSPAILFGSYDFDFLTDEGWNSQLLLTRTVLAFTLCCCTYIRICVPIDPASLIPKRGL